MKRRNEIVLTGLAAAQTPAVICASMWGVRSGVLGAVMGFALGCFLEKRRLDQSAEVG